jgi:hypothetical protein
MPGTVSHPRQLHLFAIEKELKLRYNIAVFRSPLFNWGIYEIREAACGIDCRFDLYCA